MKKWIPIFLAVLTMAGAATACSSGETNGSAPESSAAQSSMTSSEGTGDSSSASQETDSSLQDNSTASRITQDPELLKNFIGTWNLEGAGYFILKEDGSAALYQSDGTAVDEDGDYSVDGSRADITFVGFTETVTLDGNTITLDSGSVY
ncbi:MAG: hypothetical protein HFE85_03135, partial [Clostridiales bacterium]|nr:hypothetical protein [Clostridiales bacterium]